MCGIFGYVGGGRSSADAAGIVLRGLKKLEYRGYDSWGVAVAHDGTVKLERRVGKIGEASVAIAATVKPGVFAIRRSAIRTSCRRCSSAGAPC